MAIGERGMIKEFSKKVLFVPRSWLNAVTRWIQGVYSPDGSIIVKNTLNPGQDGSLEIKVNLDRIISAVAQRFGLESQLDRNNVRDIVWDMVDGASVIVDGRRISVNKEWLDQYIEQVGISFEAPSATNPVDLGGGYNSGGVTEHGTSSGSIGAGSTGVKFKVACAFGDGGAAGRIWFRELVFGDDGRLVSASGVTDSATVCTDV